MHLPPRRRLAVDPAFSLCTVEDFHPCHGIQECAPVISVDITGLGCYFERGTYQHNWLDPMLVYLNEVDALFIDSELVISEYRFDYLPLKGTIKRLRLIVFLISKLLPVVKTAN